MKNIVEIKKKQKEVLERIRKRSANIVTKEISESTSESLALDFRCSTTGRDFTIFLGRELRGKLYKVVKIVTDDVASRSSSSLFTPKTIDIDINEIEYGGIKCPYCDGGERSFIKCECGKLSCAGGVKECNGKYLHKCPWCVTEGYIEGDIQEVSGKMVNKVKIIEEKDRKKLNSDKRYATLIETR